jgi:hypothetical protein
MMPSKPAAGSVDIGAGTAGLSPGFKGGGSGGLAGTNGG